MQGLVSCFHRLQTRAGCLLERPAGLSQRLRMIVASSSAHVEGEATGVNPEEKASKHLADYPDLRMVDQIMRPHPVAMPKDEFQAYKKGLIEFGAVALAESLQEQQDIFIRQGWMNPVDIDKAQIGKSAV